MKMTVDFDFDMLEEDIQEMIIKEASRQMLEGAGIKDNNSLKSSIEKTVHQTIIELANEKLSKDIPSLIDEALNAEFTKTNMWGESIGVQKPFREFVIDTIREQLNQMVDEHGKVTSYNSKSTYLKWLIKESGKEISDEIVKKIINSI